MEHTINIPVPFDGPDEQKRENYFSHTWYQVIESEDEMYLECTECACRSHQVAATYHCGDEPARKDVTISTEALA